MQGVISNAQISITVQMQDVTSPAKKLMVPLMPDVMYIAKQ